MYYVLLRRVESSADPTGSPGSPGAAAEKASSGACPAYAIYILHILYRFFVYDTRLYAIHIHFGCTVYIYMIILYSPNSACTKGFLLVL